MSKNNLEIALSPSGHQYDKELARVKIKVSPSLQALIANQLDFIEMIEKSNLESHIFIEQHKAELYQLEEEVSQAFGEYVLKKERAREKRLQKKNDTTPAPTVDIERDFENSLGETMGSNSSDLDDLPWFSNDSTQDSSPATKEGAYERESLDFDPLNDLDKMADKLSPGLPSAKYTSPTVSVEQKADIDVRRVAIGASVKALVDFLNRPLTEEEIQTIEKQVDSYLN